MHTVAIPHEFALVLYQVEENGEEDFTNLAETLGFDRKRLSHILHALQHKKLIKVDRTPHGVWFSLSSKGKRLMAAIWPEAHTHYLHA
jgi:DNA-binding MarR family transcriptional regulator